VAWATPVTHSVGDVLTASDWNISSNDISFLAGTATATVNTSETTTSTSYADLTTPGPTVSVTTGANALVFITSYLYNNTADQLVQVGVDVSGATTIAAAAGSNSLLIQQGNAQGAIPQTATVATFIGSLTPGTNTFKLKYKVNANTGTFQNRNIVVVPLP
jgi:hypothetical protein